MAAHAEASMSGAALETHVEEPADRSMDVIRSLVAKLKRQRAQMRSMGFYPMATSLSGVIRQAEALLAVLEESQRPE